MLSLLVIKDICDASSANVICSIGAGGRDSEEEEEEEEEEAETLVAVVYVLCGWCCVGNSQLFGYRLRRGPKDDEDFSPSPLFFAVGAVLDLSVSSLAAVADAGLLALLLLALAAAAAFSFRFFSSIILSRTFLGACP